MEMSSIHPVCTGCCSSMRSMSKVIACAVQVAAAAALVCGCFIDFDGGSSAGSPDSAAENDGRADDAQPPIDGGSDPDGVAPTDGQVTPDGPPGDSDNDGIPDVDDNCPNDHNPLQEDLDGDGQGDVCDADMDGDGIPNQHDPYSMNPDTVYYYGLPGSSPNDFSLASGHSFDGSAVCRSGYGLAEATRLLEQFIGGSDYLVETEIEFVSAHSTVVSPGAGLLFRQDPEANQLHGYVCMIDFESWRLRLVEFTSGSPVFLSGSASNSVPPVGPYRLRARANGDFLNCELVPNGPAVGLWDSSHGSGTVGFFTHYSEVCFTYLTLVAE